MKKHTAIITLCLSIFLCLPSIARADPNVAISDIYSCYYGDLAGAFKLAQLQALDSAVTSGFDYAENEYEYDKTVYPPITEDAYESMLEIIEKQKADELDLNRYNTEYTVLTEEGSPEVRGYNVYAIIYDTPSERKNDAAETQEAKTAGKEGDWQEIMDSLLSNDGDKTADKNTHPKKETALKQIAKEVADIVGQPRVAMSPPRIATGEEVSITHVGEFSITEDTNTETQSQEEKEGPVDMFVFNINEPKKNQHPLSVSLVNKGVTLRYTMTNTTTTACGSYMQKMESIQKQKEHISALEKFAEVVMAISAADKEAEVIGQKVSQIANNDLENARSELTGMQTVATELFGSHETSITGLATAQSINTIKNVEATKVQTVFREYGF